MRYTLIELVQRILESMESDEVSTVGETSESLSVAGIIKECYFDIVGEINPAEQEGLFKLDASGDNTKPALMYVPSTVSKMRWVKYNDGDSLSEPSYRDLSYRSNEEFLYYHTGLDPDATSTETMTVTMKGTDYLFQIRNDTFPTYYTVFFDRYVVFDAYDSDADTTLTQARSLGFGSLVPEFELEDDFVPDLDPRQFQLLLNEAKAQAFIELKQIENNKAEKKARKNKILARQQRDDNDPGWANQRHAAFGRKSIAAPTMDMRRAMRRGV